MEVGGQRLSLRTRLNICGTHTKVREFGTQRTDRNKEAATGTWQCLMTPINPEVPP